MSDKPDPDAVKAALMADLSRFRQEELPLNGKPKGEKDTTYAPSKNNGTDRYSDAKKAVLENKWSFKIDDGESQSMKGLEPEDSRPWAKGQTRKKLSNIMVDRAAPAIPASHGTLSSHQSQRTRVQFKPTTPAKWGPPATQTASVANRQEPLPAATHNGSSSSANAVSVNGNSRTPLVTQNQDKHDQGQNASEHLLCSKQCHFVPGKKTEALSIVTSVAIKIRIADDDGILELRNDSKGLRIHNALDIETPVLDGVFCTIKVKPWPWSENLRFATVDDAQEFKTRLSKLQRCLLKRQKQEGTGESQVADKTEEINKEEDNNDLLTAASPIASTASDISIPGFNSPSQQVTITDQVPLIMANDDWGTTANNNIPGLGHETEHLGQLFHQVLEQFGALKSHSGETMNGVEYEILEQSLSHGILQECDEKVRNDTLNIIRSMFDVGCKLVSRELGPGLVDDKLIGNTGNGTDLSLRQGATAQQAEDSTNRSELGMPKGLGSSRFAKKPVAYEGNFTGPIKY